LSFEQQTYQEEEAKTTQTFPTKAGPRSSLKLSEWGHREVKNHSEWAQSSLAENKGQPIKSSSYCLHWSVTARKSVNVNCIFQLFFLQKMHEKYQNQFPNKRID